MRNPVRLTPAVGRCVSRLVSVALAALLVWAMAGPGRTQGEPALTDEMLVRAESILHADIQLGRLAGVTSRGPVAEVGAKIIDVLYGDRVAGEWVSYSQRVEGEYVKPAHTQRLLILGRDGVLLDQPFTPESREALAARLADQRGRSEALTGDRHVPDYLLRSVNNALLHVDIEKSVPFDRGRGNLSVTHTARVRGVAQGDFAPGQVVEYVEETGRRKRVEPPASRSRIVLLTNSRSVSDGQMKWWLHQRADHGYTAAGFETLKADIARVRAAQAEKAAR